MLILRILFGLAMVYGMHIHDTNIIIFYGVLFLATEIRESAKS